MTHFWAIGAVSNAIRGGQWRSWLGGEWAEVDERGKPVKWAWLNSDYINAAIYGATIFAASGNWWLTILSLAAMMAGATPGWGDYIGAILRTPDAELKENRFIDPLIRKLEDRPFLWGFAGLTLRGLWWGFCLAVPFWLHGHSDIAWHILAAGATMPQVYLVAAYWTRTRWQDVDGWKSAAWGLGEIFFGAVLWDALGGL